VLSVGALLLGGCLTEFDDGEPGESEVESAITENNGISLNGISLNGISLNGISLNGISLNGISLNGISLNGISLNGVSIRDTQLQGRKASGASVTGAALIGATLKGQMSNYGTIDLRIDSSATLPAPNSDVRVYSISYVTTAGRTPLCVGPTGANEAILFPGTWNLGTGRHQHDANIFTVSCRGATFAKCAELGYKGDALLDTYHQACTRALRADYCGDGKSHTVDGTQINIYDRIGRQTDTQTWSVEANWTTEGAICISKSRLATSLSAPLVPDCMLNRSKIPCVTGVWLPGVLLRTEVNR
jgi:uncharacterized protein YjbI with pentapeptide repeats